MTSYQRSAYGRNPHTGAARNVANGWTGVWPQGVPLRHLGIARAAGVIVPVQKGLVDLVEVLLTASEQMGYNVKAGQTWGYANRPIRGTRSPSNHSRGKAVDINSLANPFQRTFRSDMPPAMVKMWESCGWYWGGRYRTTADAMHFEYLGRPSDVDEHLAKARRFLRGGLAPTEPNPKPKARKLGSRTLKHGSRGEDVAVLQRFLGVKGDSTFGAGTEAAVRRYQREQGLDVDGRAGAKTLARILEALEP